MSVSGIAARVPYEHQTAVGCQDPHTEKGKKHELIAALSRIKFELGGEDFKEFMREGATQRSTIHAYLDLFCYQPPAHRSVDSCGQRIQPPTYFSTAAVSNHNTYGHRSSS